MNQHNSCRQHCYHPTNISGRLQHCALARARLLGHSLLLSSSCRLRPMPFAGRHLIFLVRFRGIIIRGVRQMPMWNHRIITAAGAV